MPTYSRLDLNTHVAAMVSGEYDSTKFNTIANRAVRLVLAEVDLRSTIRRSALAPNLFNDVYQYSAPVDLKGDKIIDIQPQINRGRFDYWELKTPEEFDRYKEDNRVDRWGDPIEIKSSQWLGNNIVAIDTRDFIRKILLSRPIDDDELVIDRLDDVGDWTGFGDGENLTRDTSNYVKNSASINWDINADGGTTAGIQNSSLDEFDISDYLMEGSIFVWAYISSTTGVTNFILRVGNDSSNYYSITITTNNEGTAFEAGWNLLRFDLANKTETGSVDETACTYVAIYMTKNASKTSETDYRFDNIVLKKGEHYYLRYYSKYGWQSSAGAYKENATADTDLLNVDTDEFDLIVTKCAELVERDLLRNPEGAADFREQYIAQRQRYVLDNPSQALLLTQRYYTI